MGVVAFENSDQLLATFHEVPVPSHRMFAPNVMRGDIADPRAINTMHAPHQGGRFIT